MSFHWKCSVTLVQYIDIDHVPGVGFFQCRGNGAAGGIDGRGSPHRWSPSTDGANHRGGKRGSLLPAGGAFRGPKLKMNHLPNITKLYQTWFGHQALPKTLPTFILSEFYLFMPHCKDQCFCKYQIKRIVNLAHSTTVSLLHKMAWAMKTI